MTRFPLLVFAVAVAMAAPACMDDTDTLTDGTGGAGSNRRSTDGTGAGGTTTQSGLSGPVPTLSAEGKAFYKANVHPFLGSLCGACHGQSGPGPYWLTAADAEMSYGQLASQGYVISNSRIVAKGPHGGVTTNALSAQQMSTYEQWVAIEVRDGGGKAAPNVLEKLGTCFDRAKFDAMQLGQWRTTRRTADNNVNQVNPWNENANNCTGCNNAPCSTCHSADPATNYSNAIGNNILPADTTFENSKMTAPAYITKYFGVSPDGKAVASDSIRKKSDATMRDKQYTHPMFQLTADQNTRLNAFVQDVVTRFNAGQCGQ